MHSFAHGGVVNTLASYYHVALPQTTSSWYGECPSWPLPTMVFIQTTPFVWPQMRLSMLNYYPCKPYVEIPVFLYPMVFSWVFTENLFPHFLFPQVPKMLFPQNVSIPHFRTTYDTAPKITHHQVISIPGLFLSPFTQGNFLKIIFFLGVMGVGPLKFLNTWFTLFLLDYFQVSLKIRMQK